MPFPVSGSQVSAPPPLHPSLAWRRLLPTFPVTGAGSSPFSPSGGAGSPSSRHTAAPAPLPRPPAAPVVPPGERLLPSGRCRHLPLLPGGRKPKNHRTPRPSLQRPRLGRKQQHQQQDVRRGGGERRRAQDRRRVLEGQVPDELRGGDHPGAQVRADPAARVGVGPLVAGVPGVREVAAVRQALQPLQEPRRRAPGPRDAQPLRPRRVRALHARQPLPRHQRRGHRARPIPQIRREVRRRLGQREDREDAQRPLPHQEVRVALLPSACCRAMTMPCSLLQFP